MRFGIIQEGTRAGQEAEREPVDFGLNVSVIKQDAPEAADQTALAKWLLRSLGVVNSAADDHPAVLLLLELARKRKDGKGLLGLEAVNFLRVGKTQTYYWLNRMRAAGLVSSGKRKIIEQGAMRYMKGFYLSGSDLNFTVEHVRKNVNVQLQEIQSVASRLHKALAEEGKLATEPLGEIPAAEPVLQELDKLGK